MSPTPPSAIPDAALRLLLEQGFDATSVDQLAAAAGISRSTFFRRFGTKEDMVFADMEAVINVVETVLAAGRDRPAAAVVDAALAVFDHHTSRPDASLLRHRLLQEVPALRDRELVSTHRYERTFRRGLDAAYSTHRGDVGDANEDAGHAGLEGREGREGAEGGSASVAFAAAVVAVHNAFLRRWLRGPGDAVRRDLARELRGLADLFEPRLADRGSNLAASRLPAFGAGAKAGGADQGGTVGGVRGAVVVTVLDPGAATEDIIAAVREALPRD